MFVLDVYKKSAVKAVTITIAGPTPSEALFIANKPLQSHALKLYSAIPSIETSGTKLTRAALILESTKFVRLLGISL